MPSLFVFSQVVVVIGLHAACARSVRDELSWLRQQTADGELHEVHRQSGCPGGARCYDAILVPPGGNLKMPGDRSGVRHVLKARLSAKLHAMSRTRQQYPIEVVLRIAIFKGYPHEHPPSIAIADRNGLRRADLERLERVLQGIVADRQCNEKIVAAGQRVMTFLSSPNDKCRKQVVKYYIEDVIVVVIVLFFLYQYMLYSMHRPVVHVARR